MSISAGMHSPGYFRWGAYCSVKVCQLVCSLSKEKKQEQTKTELVQKRPRLIYTLVHLHCHMIAFKKFS